MIRRVGYAATYRPTSESSRGILKNIYKSKYRRDTHLHLKIMSWSNDQSAIFNITVIPNAEAEIKYNFPEPKIGYYHAECCLLDLYKIENEEDLKEVQERINDNDECGELMIFKTLDEAIDFLYDANDDEERIIAFSRLNCLDKMRNNQ